MSVAPGDKVLIPQVCFFFFFFFLSVFVFSSFPLILWADQLANIAYLLSDIVRWQLSEGR